MGIDQVARQAESKESKSACALETTGKQLLQYAPVIANHVQPSLDVVRNMSGVNLNGALALQVSAHLSAELGTTDGIHNMHACKPAFRIGGQKSVFKVRELIAANVSRAMHDGAWFGRVKTRWRSWR